LTFLTPGFILIVLLTVSCKQEWGPLDVQNPQARAFVTPCEIRRDSDNDRMHLAGEGDHGDYAILSARGYDPGMSMWNWDSLDFSRQVRISSQDGASVELHVDFTPYPQVHTIHDLKFEIPADALFSDTTMRICAPDPGFALFSTSLIGDRKGTEPFILQQSAHIEFVIDGMHVSEITSLDVNLLRWMHEEKKWAPADGHVSIRAGHIIGFLDTDILTRFAVGVQRE
jgi:hypothetical protein